MIYFLKYWKAGLIAILVVTAIVLFKQRDTALVQRGKALERTRVADSTLKVLRPMLLRYDSALIASTARLATRLDTARVRVRVQRDTVWLPTGKPGVVVSVEEMQETETTLAGCSLVVQNCEAFRRTANATIASMQAKLDAQPTIVARSCTVPILVSGTLGLAGGYLAGGVTAKRR